MLIHNPEPKLAATQTSDKRGPVQKPAFVEYSPREMLIGHVVLILLLAIAVLLRSVQ